MTPTASSTPLPTSTRIVFGGASEIVIGELRTRGPQGAGDEYISLFNRGQSDVDVSGWKLEAYLGAPAPEPQTLLIVPANTSLKPGQHFLAANNSVPGYSGATKPDASYQADLPDNTGVALTLPNDALVDQVGFSSETLFKEGRALAPFSHNLDQSYERKPGGVAGQCVDTNDNASDLQIAPSQPQALSSPLTPCNVTANVSGATANHLSYTSSYFVRTVHGPSVLTQGLDKIVRNLLLAILLAILFGASGNLLADTLENHEDEVLQKLGPLARLIVRSQAAGNTLGGHLGRRGMAWLGDVLKVVLVLVIYGIVFAFLDPSFNPVEVAMQPQGAPMWLSIDAPVLGQFLRVPFPAAIAVRPDALWTMVALMLSVGLLALTDDIAKLLYVRRLGASATVRVHGGNFIFAVLSVLFSRMLTLTPGIVFGNVGGLEGEIKGDEKRLNLIAIGAVGLVALVAWLGLDAVPHEGTTLWLATLCALIFAVGIQTLFFEMLPFHGTYGREILRSWRGMWFVLFVGVTFIFVQTQLNPDGDFVGAFQKPNMVALTLFVLGFCAVSASVWFYFWQKDRAEVHE